MVKAVIVCLVMIATISAQQPQLEFSPTGSVVIQAQKDLYDNDRSDNLDNWFGRLDLGGVVESGRHSVDVMLRFYPEGFGHDFRGPGMKTVDVMEFHQGYQVIQGPGTFPIYIPYEDTTIVGQDTIMDMENMQEFSMERVQIRRALYRYDGDMLNLTIGRDLISETEGKIFGNYIDEGIHGSGFLGKGIFANFLSLEKQMDMASLTVLLEATSANLNTGNLRTWFDVTPMENLEVGLGYKSNIFDKVYDDDMDVIHSLALNTAYTLPSQVTLFAETGVKDLHEDLDAYAPVLLGANIPLPGMVRYVQVETELLKTGDRERLTGIEDTPVLYGISSCVELNDNVEFALGFFSAYDAEKPTIAAEFRGGF
ncbi:hypothetical protein [Chitinivibrio alkaliphilus]|uniref:Uncharacterized protein n=1 Tax=Chitinivibrio alkaliphilus ACht1 TaxID=1313304 RepID=U7DE56_9BACT|nr:hypothetical protein [Chitinivibrio alkaliphilus]ERP39206.1 hypothetical protein CALK_0376 [Chitinivibrio alkaliphilus ACht1]